MAAPRVVRSAAQAPTHTGSGPASPWPHPASATWLHHWLVPDTGHSSVPTSKRTYTHAGRPVKFKDNRIKRGETPSSAESVQQRTPGRPALRPPTLLCCFLGKIQGDRRLRAAPLACCEEGEKPGIGGHPLPLSPPPYATDVVSQRRQPFRLPNPRAFPGGSLSGLRCRRVRKHRTPNSGCGWPEPTEPKGSGFGLPLEGLAFHSTLLC